MPGERFDDLLDPGFLDGLIDLTLDELRARRATAIEVETGLSFLRRVVQGRLDIVLAEIARREAGGEPGDIADLVKRLPSILGERVHAPGLGRLPTFLAPGELDHELVGRLDAILAPERLGDLPELAEDELSSVADRLGTFEHDVSARRRRLHEVLDRLQEEIVRRYRTGEATVDSLLQ